MQNSLDTLEFFEIKQQLLTYAATQSAREKIESLAPILNEARLRGALHETNDARKILDFAGTPPLPDTETVKVGLTLAEKGALLPPQQLMTFAAFGASCKRMKAYLKKAEATDTALSHYGATIDPLEELTLEIHRCIAGGARLRPPRRDPAERRNDRNARLRVRQRQDEP